MTVPECPDCGATEGLCRDVAPGTNPRLVFREIKCVNCGAKRKSFMAYLPEEFQDASMKELSEDRLITTREAAYRRRGKGVFRRTDTLMPALVRVWVSVSRRGHRKPKVGHNGWAAREAFVQAGTPDHRSNRAVDVTEAPLWSESDAA